jgi:AcrR family transcriptional regulator
VLLAETGATPVVDAERPAAAEAPDAQPDLLGERLLDAAGAVFAERGFDGAGVAEIARRAGVTTGAIYSRFTGKADLLVAAIDARTSDEFDELFADHRFEGRTEDIIRVAGSQLVNRDPDPGEALLLEAFVAARRDPQVADLLRRRMYDRRASLTQVIEAAKDGGGIDDRLDTEALVAFCHAVGFGFLLIEALGLSRPDPGAWEQLITRLVAAAGDRSLHPDAPRATGTPPSPPPRPSPNRTRKPDHVF